MDRKYDVILDKPEIGCRVRIIEDTDGDTRFHGMTGLVVVKGAAYKGKGLGVDIDNCPPMLGHTLDGQIPTHSGRWISYDGLEIIYE